MAHLISAVRQFASDEEGAAIVEYALLVALIALVAVVVIGTLGTKVSEKFSEMASQFETK